MSDSEKKPRKAPPPIPIHRGTTPSNCKRCGAVMYWAPHPTTGNAHPTSVDTCIEPRCKEPTEHEDGLGVSHYANCSNANEFRGIGKRGSPPI